MTREWSTCRRRKQRHNLRENQNGRSATVSVRRGSDIDRRVETSSGSEKAVEIGPDGQWTWSDCVRQGKHVARVEGSGVKAAGVSLMD